jgi:hypothetical protein
LDVVEKYCEKGLQYTNENNMNPVILHVVGEKFDGSNLESNTDIRDDLIIMRTTFRNTLGFGSSQAYYPLQENGCVYAKAVTIIRPPMMNSFLPYPMTYRTAVITTCATQVKSLLKNDKMNSTDFINTCTTIETVFHTAIAKNHQVLILTPFGNNEEDKNPVMDIVKIYNYCIFKYGHYFTKIIVAIPSFYSKDIFETFHQNIINPIILTNQIDEECEEDEIKYALMSKSLSNTKEKQQEMPQDMNLQNIPPEQMQMMMNMMMQMGMLGNNGSS